MRILLIEDETRIQSFVRRGLEAEGYGVVTADDGRDGLSLARSGEWDLVVLDLLLPGMNGLRVLHELHRERPLLPVVILSARGDLRTKLRGSSSAPPTTWRSRSRSTSCSRASASSCGARARRARTSTCYTRAACSSTLRAGRRVSATAADLSDREFRLLHHLLLHAGEVISRERLLADVWGYDFDPGSNVVDVCVRRLRQKLGPDAHIETIRHAGYRLAAA